MCGLAGFYSPPAQLPLSLLQSMTEAIGHRGPDAQGMSLVRDGEILSSVSPLTHGEGGQIGMGHRRLSILDLEARSNQPMVSQSGDVLVAYNGEIYNYLELARTHLEKKLSTTGDTEVLVEMWSKYGPRCLAHLNGMYAFSVYERSQKKLWLVRDPHGIKPLYYRVDAGVVYWGSEIRALMPTLTSEPKLRVELVASYLASHYIADPDTLFKDIYRVPPGCYLEIGQDGQPTLHRFFTPQAHTSILTSEEKQERLEHHLSRAVSFQMRSDVEMAFFLSGGLDSSLLVQKASTLEEKKTVTCFTTGFDWKDSQAPSQDLTLASRLAHDLHLSHQKIKLSPQVMDTLSEVVLTLEEPVADPAALCSYLICEKASKSYKVMVSGQGSDEIFGGYPYYPKAQWLSQWERLPSLLKRGIAWGLRKLPYSLGGKRFERAHQLKKLGYLLQLGTPDQYFYLRSGWRPDEIKQVLLPQVYERQQPPFQSQRALWETLEGSVGEKLAQLDRSFYLPCNNLFYTDKTSMKHSLEVRVPFLDNSLVEFASHLQWEDQVQGRSTKVLLHDYAQKVLPSYIVERKKEGFGLPLRDWFLEDLKPLTDVVFETTRLEKQGLFNPHTIQRWLVEHQKRKQDHSFKLFSLLVFELWMEHFEVQH